MGQYANLEIKDTLDMIPARLANDEKFLDVMSKLMLLRIEKYYYEYVKMLEDTHGHSVEAILSMLEEQKQNELDKIYSMLKSVETEKEN